jgi:hypothetical protein
MDIKQRLKYVVETVSRGKHTVFAKKCGIPPGSFQAYINGQRIPPTEHLIRIVTVCGINLNWLLIGEGEPFLGEMVPEGEATKLGQNDPVLQLLNDEEQRTGITITPDQHTAILKIFRELIERDIRAIRELLRSIPGKQAT